MTTELSPNKFWEEAHTRNVMQHIGDNDSKLATRGFQQFKNPSFSPNFAKAKSYLDIGPGTGFLLKESEAVLKAAMDISSTALTKIKSDIPSLETYLSTDTPPGDRFDLITCISVVQHCDEGALSSLLSFAHTTLKQNGSFYVEGLSKKPESAHYSTYQRMFSGSFLWTIDDVLGKWPGSLKNIFTNTADDGLEVWWAELAKRDII